MKKAMIGLLLLGMLLFSVTASKAQGGGFPPECYQITVQGDQAYLFPTTVAFATQVGAGGTHSLSVFLPAGVIPSFKFDIPANFVGPAKGTLEIWRWIEEENRYQFIDNFSVFYQLNCSFPGQEPYTRLTGATLEGSNSCTSFNVGSTHAFAQPYGAWVVSVLPISGNWLPSQTYQTIDVVYGYYDSVMDGHEEIETITLYRPIGCPHINEVVLYVQPSALNYPIACEGLVLHPEVIDPTASDILIIWMNGDIQTPYIRNQYFWIWSAGPDVQEQVEVFYEFWRNGSLAQRGTFTIVKDCEVPYFLESPPPTVPQLEIPSGETGEGQLSESGI